VSAIRRAVLRRVGEASRFLIVGGVGFIVDATLLLALVHGAGLSRAWSRIPSFLVAVTVTWWLHRHYTFEHARHVPPTIREWMHFAFANAFGNGVNLALYWTLIGFLAWDVLPALAVASVVAAGINYAMSARWVFRTKSAPSMSDDGRTRPPGGAARDSP